MPSPHRYARPMACFTSSRVCPPPRAPSRSPRDDAAHEVGVVLVFLRALAHARHLFNTRSMSGFLHSRQPMPALRQPWSTQRKVSSLE